MHTSIRRARTARSPFLVTSFAVGALALSACSSGSGSESDAFVVRGTPWAVGGGTKVAVSGNLIAWVADEATTGASGTDLNGDGDKLDGVAVGVVANTQGTFVVGVAASELAWIGSQLFLVVSEAADGEDWNGDTDTTDTVLLRWSVGASGPTFIDVVDTAGSTRLVTFGSRLVYASADVAIGANATNLRTIEASTPSTIATVASTDNVGPLRPRLVSQDEGLVFLALNESTEARVLNGDGDSTDTTVLALLDLRTSAGAVVRNVGLAWAGTASPVRAKFVATSDWQVGFLVNESAQGATNLDDPTLFTGTWQPTQCIGFADTDTNDNVLHYLRFAAWVADPVSNPVRNTGLVGVDKIAIANGFIATITPENAAAGLGEGTCDLNQDGDKTDRVVRWTQIVTGTSAITPLNTAANLHALDDTPGGVHGLSELQNRFVIVVDEAQDGDIDGNNTTQFDLVGWLLPSTSTVAWQFLHSGTYVGASWLNETRDRNRLVLGFQESVGGVSLNPGVSGAPGDSDTLDSIPTFPVFNGSGVLTFPGVKIAVDPNAPGIVVARGLGFYRVAESADNRDWTNDGAKDDRVMFRSSFTTGTTAINGTSAAVNRNAIEIEVENGSPACAAFLTDEALQGASGTDINGDGDAIDLVVQYFTFQ